MADNNTMRKDSSGLLQELEQQLSAAEKEVAAVKDTKASSVVPGANSSEGTTIFKKIDTNASAAEGGTSDSVNELFNVATSAASEPEDYAALEAEIAAVAKEQAMKKKRASADADDLLNAATADGTSEYGGSPLAGTPMAEKEADALENAAAAATADGAATMDDAGMEDITAVSESTAAEMAAEDDTVVSASTAAEDDAAGSAAKVAPKVAPAVVPDTVEQVELDSLLASSTSGEIGEEQEVDLGDSSQHNDGDMLGSVAASPEEPPVDNAQGQNNGANNNVSVAANSELQDTIESLNQEIVALKQKAEQHREAALQVQADAVAEKDRMQREMEKKESFIMEKSLQELLPVMDSIEFGIQAADAGGNVDVSALREGMALTLDLFGKFMASAGVEIINPVGKKFDPEMHEAVSVQSVPGAASDQVVNVVQKGYALNGRLLRPAKVIVSG